MNLSFRALNIFLLVYAVAIILWGAFVRISGSGDGCGAHWPLCHGEWIPSANLRETLQTWIEYAHRIKSGLFGILVFVSGLWSLRIFPKGHVGRKLSLSLVLVTVFEALLGAALVVFGYVDQDASEARIFVIALHLGNTLLLLGVLTLLIRCDSAFKFYQIRGFLKSPLLWGALAILAVGITGSWAALSNTLYPSSDLFSGFVSDWSSTSPLLVRLRLFHPLLALGSALLLTYFYFSRNPDEKKYQFFVPLVFLQVCFGVATLFSLSPVWMKLTHLLLADVLWVSFVWIFTEPYLKTRQTGQQPLALNQRKVEVQSTQAL